MLSTSEPGQHIGDAPRVAWADLGIGRHRREGDCYAADVRFVRPDSATDERVDALVRVEFDRLRALLLDGLAPGAHRLRYYAVDAAGNRSLEAELSVTPRAP
jgi:hypothetical protein